jgi:CHASE2 domain-containing sensor protein
MKRRWRHFAICALIAFASAAGARLLSTLRFFQLLNLKSLDAQFVLRGRQTVSGIVLVVADQKALDTFPELQILWHPYYADAIRAASQSGAKVIGLDLAFAVPVEKWEPDYDRLLSEAVSASPIPVVCADFRCPSTCLPPRWGLPDTPTSPPTMTISCAARN